MSDASAWYVRGSDLAREDSEIVADALERLARAESAEDYQHACREAAQLLAFVEDSNIPGV